MYVLPFGSVYGVFGGKGQRSLLVGEVAVVAVEEGTTGTLVVPGGTGVVGPPDVGPTGVGPAGVDSTGVDSTDVDMTGVDSTGVDSTGVDSTGPTGVD